ncbi:lysoplasmalogenase family protein [Massiliimalia massiliensis]|uniref:lysoplasmalogenase family protein n=1 Tax=Massiliimalia massiliensis TaxID=1852384 RepID=UPI0009864A23|nr:lysoplasmalogenase family protein [Massiliimalia massiliensis]
MLAVVLILYAVVFGMLIATCYHPKWKSRHVLVKTIQSLGFIWIATIASYYSRDFGFYFSMLPGFVLCLCGDISLAFNDRKPSDRTFLIGVGSFLIGHILFLTAFYRIASFSWTDLIFPVLMVGVSYLLTRMKKMDVQNMLPCVLIYSFFVSALCGKGAQIAMTSLSNQAILLGVGSFLFLVSDMIILFLFFYQTKYVSGKFWNLLTYYGGLLCLALSILY